MRKRNRSRGSTLIELLTVVAIIFITASLPTPRLHKELIPAHEASVLAGIKAIHEAEMMFAKTHPDQGFTPELATLGSTDSDGSEPIIDNVLASGRKSGYTFTYTAGEKTNGAIRSYTITAVPDQVGTTGRRRFYSDESGEVHYNASGPANAGSPTIR
jgi:Tfp pilus assembly protein PilE